MYPPAALQSLLYLSAAPRSSVCIKYALPGAVALSVVQIRSRSKPAAEALLKKQLCKILGVLLRYELQNKFEVFVHFVF